jgi:hypothetical protein
MTHKVLIGLTAALVLNGFLLPRLAAQGVAAAAAPPAPKFALLVGVGDYEVNKDPAAAARFKVRGNIKNLSGPKNDVEDVRALLVEKFEFPDDKAHVRTLVNREATREDILGSLKNFLLAAAREHRTERPTVVFYFAGHGRQAADVNGDEGDGTDETLVPVDSDVGGVNRDIIDDELDEILQQLVPLTPNITFVIDSCHSGTVTRSFDEALVARQADDRDDAHPPPAAEEQRRRGARAEVKSLDLGSELLSWSGRYVAVAGCLPHERSYENAFPAQGGGRRVSGLMTRALLELLTANPTMTFRELKEDLANKVGRMRISQNPQIEGDLDRPVFGGGDPRLTNSVAITWVGEKTLRVAVGRMQGVRPGALLAIYPVGGARTAGGDGRLATARVTEEIGTKEASAEIIASPSNREFTKEGARAVMVAPDFGEDRLRVALDSAGARDAAAVRKLYAVVAENLKASMTVALVRTVPAASASAGGSWDVTVGHGKFGEVFPDYVSVRAGADGLPAADEQVYYVAGRDGRPLHNFWAVVREGVTSIEAAADRIALALESIARQGYLRRLVNKVSTLNGKVRVTFLRLVNIQEEPDPKRPGFNRLKSFDPKVCREDQGSVVILRPGDRYQLSVENISDADLYVSALILGSSGGIFPMIPARGGPGERLERNKPPLRSVVYKAGLPLGLESYKVIVTKVAAGSPAPDFDFLYQARIRRGDGRVYDPLRWLDYMGAATRGEPETPMRFDDWTTARVDVEMRADAGTMPLAARPCTPQ